MRSKRIFQWSREDREGWKMQPTLLPRLLMCNIELGDHYYLLGLSKEAAIPWCLASPSTFQGPEAKGEPSPAQTGCFPPRSFTDARQKGHEECFSEMNTSLQIGFTSWKQNQKSLRLKATLPKITAFLSSLSFYVNNVHMSLEEINKTQEFFNFPWVD